MSAPAVQGTRAPRDVRRLTRSQVWVVAVILLVVGASLGVGAVHWGLNRVRDLDHLEHHGAFATARVASTTQTGAPSGSVCVSLVSVTRAVVACPPVDDPGAFSVGYTVTVRYDLAHRDQMLVVGHEPDISPVVWALLGAASIVVTAALVLAASWRDDDGEQATGVAWVVWMGLAGLSSWLGIGYAAMRMGHRRVLWWVPVYGAGLVGTVALYVTSIARPGLELVATGLWLAVWIGGTVHGVLLVPTVSRERVWVTERRHSTQLPPPPRSASAWMPSTPTRLARRSVVGAVDLPWLADPDATSDGTPPTVHAASDGRVVCGASTAFLLPTLRRWGSSGPNPAISCPECESMIDRPAFRRRGRSPSVGGARAMWRWKDSSAAVGLFWGAALLIVIQAVALALGFAPGAGGSPTRGLIVLVVCLLADVLLVVKWPRPRTEVHPWGLVVVGVWSRQTLPWDDVAFFGPACVVLVDGSCAWMPDAHRVGSVREALNRRCGVEEPALPYPWGGGLVELPTVPANEPRAAGSSGVLHAVGANGAPACGPTDAMCLPTFRPWRGQDHGCLSVCGPCQELVPPTPRSRVPVLPLYRPAKPLPGGEWVTAHDRSSAWGVFLAWLVCAVWLLPVIGLWMLYRWLTLSSRLGADGLVVRQFWRTRQLAWSEVVAFEAEAAAVVALTRVNRRIRLESLHLLGSDTDTFVATLNLVLERGQAVAIEVDSPDRVAHRAPSPAGRR